MTLKELIDSEPANASRTAQEVFDWLNEDSDAYHETMINARSLMANLGATEGATILEKLEAASAGNAAVKWALSFMTDGGLDVGNTETRNMLDTLATASVLTTDEASSVKGLATTKTRWEKEGLSKPKLGHVEALT